jgi:hypothetical protein
MKRPKRGQSRSPSRVTGTSADDPNPFEIPTATDVYAVQEESARRKKANWRRVKKMPISERAFMNAPPVSHRAVRRRYEEQMHHEQASMDDEIKPVSEIRQRQQHATHLIQEQREIFLSNLLIERHQKELGRVQSQKDVKQQKLIGLESDWKEAQKNSRATTGQYEAMKMRARQKFESQKKRRMEIESEVRRKTQAIAAMESQIVEIEDTFNRFQAYDNLLKDIESVAGHRPQTTEEFLEFFESIELESLFILRNVGDFDRKDEASLVGVGLEVQTLVETLARTSVQIDRAEKELQQLRLLQPPKIGNTDATDSALARAHNLIAAVFRECYPQGDLPQGSLNMLAKIEAELDAMTKAVGRIDQAFLAKKLKAISLEKRAQQRQANQEKKSHDQANKLEQMLERATRPVKRKEGRPLTPRITPIRAARKDSERAMRDQQEKGRIEDLLYGPVFK